MGILVSPKVFLVGFTEVEPDGIRDYLKYTGQEEFLEDLADAVSEGISGGEALCSMFAKICYKSLVVGKNSNIKKTRSISNNLKATYDSAHGSVFEHANLNFIVTDCSRVFTHELVRHRVGTAFSQTSGRYCRLDSIDLVWDPILDPVKPLFMECLSTIEDTVYLVECALGLRAPTKEQKERATSPESYVRTKAAQMSPEGKERAKQLMWPPDDSFNFDKRKKLTSAIRRIAPNGQSNEIAFSVNIRALRHFVQVRTAPGAESEIRDIASQIYHLVKAKYPLMFYKARTKVAEGHTWVYGMKLQPYEIEIGDPKALQFHTTEQLSAEIFERAHNPEHQYEGKK